MRPSVNYAPTNAYEGMIKVVYSSRGDVGRASSLSKRLQFKMSKFCPKGRVNDYEIVFANQEIGEYYWCKIGFE